MYAGLARSTLALLIILGYGDMNLRRSSRCADELVYSGGNLHIPCRLQNYVLDEKAVAQATRKLCFWVCLVHSFAGRGVLLST
jgi:hypothetical protein